jgi:prepilin-type N-terminal cleavage/methylation domain-containing protein
MSKRGFTIIEIVIVITIMGILLTLAVAGISSSQINARDTERTQDMTALTAHLE